MPTTHAAAKALRQNNAARIRNQRIKDSLKKLRIRLRKAYTAAQLDQAATLTKELVRAYDKATQKKVVPRNAAARYKSRLLRRLQKSKV
jgi:small subunit ribosomal protein S20